MLPFYVHLGAHRIMRQESFGLAGFGNCTRHLPLITFCNKFGSKLGVEFNRRVSRYDVLHIHFIGENSCELTLERVRYRE